MKKVTPYVVLLLVFMLAVGFIIAKCNKKEEGFMPLKERTGSLAAGNEYMLTKKKAEALYNKIKKKSRRHKVQA